MEDGKTSNWVGEGESEILLKGKNERGKWG